MPYTTYKHRLRFDWFATLLTLGMLASLAFPDMARATSAWQKLYTRSKASQGATIDVRAVGDIMLGRHIAEVGTERGFDSFFAAIAAQGETPLLGGDLTIGNLESPLAAALPTRADPLRLVGPLAAAPALAHAGIDVLSLANNHAYDATDAGLAQSDETLRHVGITPLGIGATALQARAATLRNVNGLQVALLAANSVRGVHDPASPPQHWQRAELDTPFITSVAAASATADLTIVVVHWGDEYGSKPSSIQQQMAARLVAAGADLIIGAHTHVLQPFAIVEADGRRGMVLYSLGNLLFDQITRWETSSGAVARVLLDRDGVVELAAAPIDLVGWRVRLLPPDSREGRQVLNAFGAVLPQTTTEAPHPSLIAWGWNGTNARSKLVSRRAASIIHPETLYVDLRGDGNQQLVQLHNGIVSIHASDDELDPIVWDSRALGWQVFRMLAGDADNDGRQEVVLLLIKPDRNGILRVHPHMIAYRIGQFKLIWGGSPRPTEIRDIALGDFDNDGRNELAFVEGGATADKPGNTVAIFRWQSWFFYEEWRSPRGTFYTIDSRDLDQDGTPELLAETEPDPNFRTIRQSAPAGVAFRLR